MQHELGAEPKDRYDRTLAYLSREGEMHNRALLSEGYARVLTIPPNDKYATDFEEAQRAAKPSETASLATCDRNRRRAVARRRREEDQARRAGAARRRVAREARRAARAQDRRQARRALATARAPGWDTSHDETDGVTHLASYGLGSPFPEDAKLCAAPSSFWPAVAPDAERSFSRPFATATPLTDEEIGLGGELPWDGVAGPRVGGENGARAIEYARFDHVDYVESALEGRFSLALTGAVDVEEYTARVIAMARCHAALSLDPGDHSWRLSSFRASPGGDEERGRAESEGGGYLGESAYLAVFSRA